MCWLCFFCGSSTVDQIHRYDPRKRGAEVISSKLFGIRVQFQELSLTLSAQVLHPRLFSPGKTNAGELGSGCLEE